MLFFNHGSFGACPRPVFETYQNIQRDLESNPVDFLGRRQESMIAAAREKLAAYLNTGEENLLFVSNATTGMNTVAGSLTFEPGDELLTTNHEYGAVDRMWEYISRHTGLRIVRQEMPVPVTTHEEFVERFWQGVTPRTRIISISHVTSPTALTFPIEEICRRAREAGIYTIIDGAHAPGQMPIDLEAIGADFYTGNCHKWMCAPKGAGFLYVRPEYQHLIDPLVIGHGWVDDSTFISRGQWQGTRDTSAYLAVPAAIEFMESHDWASVQQRCHQQAVAFTQRLCDYTGLQPFSPLTNEWFSQMVAVPLPDCDQPELARRIWEDYHIVVPVYPWNNQNRVRVSFQAYNTQEDIDQLFTAFTELLPVLTV
ncbi:MAG: aminotransferase class V-fold PLP-dependent enzyme [Anaerolineae bacterium]|nr:aminotransferase class V-fold PLP-dependent enzyme [Anaerolineae bacterium]